MNDILIKNLLNEGKTNHKYTAGCLMLSFEKKVKNWDDVLKMIEPDDLYDDETKSYGFEHAPHITVLYGFDPEVKGYEVQKLLEDVNQYIKVRLTGINIFEGKGDTPYDVVKFTIESSDLEQLHEKCKELPHKLTFPDYKPHMTIAYVKKGRGQRYVKEFKQPFYMEGSDFVYSDVHKHKTNWKIKKKYKYEISINEKL